MTAETEKKALADRIEGLSYWTDEEGGTDFYSIDLTGEEQRIVVAALRQPSPIGEGRAFTPELLNAAYQALSYVARWSPEGPIKDAADERVEAFRAAIKAMPATSGGERATKPE